MQAQIKAIWHYREELEDLMGADTTEEMGMNSIADQWIQMHSAQFRKHWDESVKKPV